MGERMKTSDQRGKPKRARPDRAPPRHVGGIRIPRSGPRDAAKVQRPFDDEACETIMASRRLRAVVTDLVSKSGLAPRLASELVWTIYCEAAAYGEVRQQAHVLTMTVDNEAQLGQHLLRIANACKQSLVDIRNAIDEACDPFFDQDFGEVLPDLEVALAAVFRKFMDAEPSRRALGSLYALPRQGCAQCCIGREPHSFCTPRRLSELYGGLCGDPLMRLSEAWSGSRERDLAPRLLAVAEACRGSDRRPSAAIELKARGRFILHAAVLWRAFGLTPREIPRDETSSKERQFVSAVERIVEAVAAPLAAEERHIDLDSRLRARWERAEAGANESVGSDAAKPAEEEPQQCARTGQGFDLFPHQEKALKEAQEKLEQKLEPKDNRRFATRELVRRAVAISKDRKLSMD